MAMRNDAYWKEREEEAKRQAIRDEVEYNKRLEGIYKYTRSNIERTVNDWYARYSEKNHITIAEAKKRVRNIDMQRYERLAEKYVKEKNFSAEANEQMDLYNLTMKVNRLEMLKAEINLELIAGYDDIYHEMERDLLEQAIKTDARYAGILGKSVIGNQRYAREIVNASFHNATFSERLWGANMPDLRAHLEAELRNGLIQGINPIELARRFRKHYDGSKEDTERLLRTEMRRVQTSVQEESYKRNGFKEYTFITIGVAACPHCAEIHGKHFKVSEMQVGKNAPPMHPNCRCSTAAYMDNDKYSRWIEALASGEDVRWDEFQSGEYEKRKAEEAKAEKKPAKKITEETAKRTEKEQAEIDGAFEYYVSGEGMYINDHLAGRFEKNGGTWTKEDEEILRLLDEGTSDIVKQKTLYRSVDASAVFGEMSDIEFGNLESYIIYGADSIPKREQIRYKQWLKDVDGKTLEEPRLMSTTTKKQTALDWGGFSGGSKPIVIEFDVPEGTRGADLKRFDEPDDPQDEVLLHRGQKYTIKSISSEGGSIYIKAKIKK